MKKLLTRLFRPLWKSHSPDPQQRCWETAFAYPNEHRVKESIVSALFFIFCGLGILTFYFMLTDSPHVLYAVAGLMGALLGLFGLTLGGTRD